ncbi:hypothetical protein ACIBTP_06320 [Streptomyces avidinii]|uniref:hypothetical protein n=1 Tax=Streptomyces avidinii TaxID=1895 RepID=UPI0037891923
MKVTPILPARAGWSPGAHAVSREPGEHIPPKGPWDTPLTLEALAEVKGADRDTFRADCPGIPGSAESYAERLPAALAPTFEGAARPARRGPRRP